jgi:hypothetical protein
MSTPEKRGNTGSADATVEGISATRSLLTFSIAIPSRVPESSIISKELAGQQSYAPIGVSPDWLTAR